MKIILIDLKVNILSKFGMFCSSFEMKFPGVKIFNGVLSLNVLTRKFFLKKN